MASCPHASACIFYTTVEVSVLKRIKFASAFPYCNGNLFVQCALYERISAGRPVEPNLLPSGGLGDYLDTGGSVISNERYLVVDDSPVFATIVANTVRSHAPQAEVIECRSFEDAEKALADGAVVLVVSGYGVGGGRTAQDVRRLTSAPMVVLSGRPESEVTLPSNSRLVPKGAGPSAITSAIDGLLGR